MQLGHVGFEAVLKSCISGYDFLVDIAFQLWFYFMRISIGTISM